MKNNYKENIATKEISGKDIPNTARVYAEVFAGKPWFEVSKCNNCGEFSSNMPNRGNSCGNCSTGKLSLPAYSPKETQQYIRTELSKQNALGLLAIQLSISKLVGFGWGYELTGEKLGRDKYSLQEMQETVNNLLINMGVFYYISEVGVIESSQGLGIGKKLTNKLMDYGKKINGALVLRTNEDSAMRYIAENAGMVPVVGLNSGIKDIENEQRVVFVSRK